MEEDIYRKKECELCGKYAFEKHLGTSNILDGGFTRNEKFEKSGFGCMIIDFWDMETPKNKRIELRLCPDCAGKIDRAISKVIKELKQN